LKSVFARIRYNLYEMKRFMEELLPDVSHRLYNTSGRPPGITAALLYETRWKFHSSAIFSNSCCRKGMKQ